MSARPTPIVAAAVLAVASIAVGLWLAGARVEGASVRRAVPPDAILATPGEVAPAVSPATQPAVAPDKTKLSGALQHEYRDAPDLRVFALQAGSDRPKATCSTRWRRPARAACRAGETDVLYRSLKAESDHRGDPLLTAMIDVRASRRGTDLEARRQSTQVLLDLQDPLLLSTYMVYLLNGYRATPDNRVT